LIREWAEETAAGWDDTQERWLDLDILEHQGDNETATLLESGIVQLTTTPIELQALELESSKKEAKPKAKGNQQTSTRTG
jgi:hypothetical protein